MIDFSGFDPASLAKFLVIAVAIGLTLFAALIVKQTGQMIEVLPTSLSPVVRLAGIIYLIACIIAVGILFVVL